MPAKKKAEAVRYLGTGRRKSSVARVTLVPGTGVITVNGVKVDIPSYQVKVGDVIAVRENSLEHGAIKEAVEACTSRPAFVDFDKNKMSGTYLRLPDRSELNQEVNETLIVEFYNR